MRQTVLIVPGHCGSIVEHWQSWLKSAHPGPLRICSADQRSPVLARWAEAVRQEIDEARHAVWIVAHGFGCLASVVAASDRPEKVAGALLVAPADPERITPLGVVAEHALAPEESIAPWLPHDGLAFSSVLVDSRKEQGLSATTARAWAERWGSRYIDDCEAGSIGAESGSGAWPSGLSLLHAMQQAHGGLPLGDIGEGHGSRRGRQSALARIRHLTRGSLDIDMEPLPSDRWQQQP